MLIALALSAALAATDPASPAPTPTAAYHRKRRKAVKKTSAAADARRERLRILTIQHEAMRDILVEAGTETPMFEDAAAAPVARGISVGPTAVDVDFLGSPIVRARVRNATADTVDLLLTAIIVDRSGRRVEASAAVERLAGGDTRSVELFCPAIVVPAKVFWKAMRL